MKTDGEPVGDGQIQVRRAKSQPGTQRGDQGCDRQAGVDSDRYHIGRAQLPAMVGLLAGGTLAAMLPVLDGHATWREIGADTVELLLVALGIDRAQARAIATTELPPLAPPV